LSEILLVPIHLWKFSRRRLFTANGNLFSTDDQLWL